MSLIKSNNVGSSGDGPFYDDVAITSLRCDAESNPKLVANGISGNRKTWTWSCWVKRSSLGSAHIVFNVGVTGTDEIDFHFTAADQFIISDRGGHNLKTTQLFRDTSAWYNLVVVMDTVQSGVTFDSANALKLYVNGVRVTSFASGTSLPDENDVFSVNHTRIHHIATRNLGDNDFDGYLAEMNLIDGTAIGETNGYLDEFGELKNGVWIPKNTSGLTFGNNGFRLQFKEIVVGDGDTDTIGADTKPSGTKHHFDSSGIVVSDCAMPDSPENNFCTMNILTNADSLGTSEGSLEWQGDTYSRSILGTFGMKSGKWYWETLMLAGGAASNGYNAGIANHFVSQSTQDPREGSISGGKVVISVDSRGDFNETQGSASNTSNSTSFSPDDFDIIGIALDMDSSTQTIAFYKNNSIIGSARNLIVQDIEYFPEWDSRSFTNTPRIANFGADQTFAGVMDSSTTHKTPSNSGAGTADENDNGKLFYAPPDGYLSLCSANLEEPVIGSNSGAGEQATDYFGVLTYTGNDAANRAIVSGGTGIGGEISFKPDWLWHKARDVANFHFLFDSTRGVGKRLSSNASAAEGNASGLDSFDVGGFTVDHEASAQDMNASAHTYVAWNWKANGNTKSTLTSGTIDSVVQASTKSGFSIVTYTGDDQARATVAHGLDKAPEMIIVKNRDEAITGPAWAVYHAFNTSAPATDYLDLSTTGDTDDAETLWSDEVPTDTLVILGTADSVNSGSAHVMYCFHSVEGYSRLGSYVGNGVTSGDGTFIYLGFRPAWLMIKNSTAAGEWLLLDNARNPFNEVDIILNADADTKEADFETTNRNIDFLSNGFKIKSNAAGGTTATNTTNATYIYMAFAEAPFKYANAR